MAEDSTTRMRVDLSELKKEFKDAQRQIQLVNSEFKAATAGMAKWADDADGVSAKIEQLNGVLAAENVKLQSLEDQYKLVAQEQGENSRGAQELLIRINNQKAAIERTQAALVQYGDRLENLQSESQKAATATEQLQSKISDQQTELDSLKNKYTDLVLEQGESSDEAKQLASEIQELSQELRQNKQKLEQATQAAGNLGEELDDAGDGAEDSAGGFTVLKGALADLVADGIKEAVSAIKELARKFEQDNPVLIYLPEADFDQESFLASLEECFKTKNNLIVCVSEGIHDKDGTFICEYAASAGVDAFGHKMLTGCGKYLENLVRDRLGVKVRSVELNVNQRCSAFLQSETDALEAAQAGAFGVTSSISGETGKMVSFVRKSDKPYVMECGLEDVNLICNQEKTVPVEWITKDGTDIAQAFIDYAFPLIQGCPKLPMKDGLAVYAYRKPEK